MEGGVERRGGKERRIINKMEQFRHSISDSSWCRLLLSSRQKACQLEVREEAISSHAFSCSICTCREKLGYYYAELS